MFEIDVPGFKKLKLKYLVMDYNGTMAIDGHLIPGLKERIKRLSSFLEIHILTADTFGEVKNEIDGLPCILTILPDSQNQSKLKLDYIKKLGSKHSAAIGNGCIDKLMLKASVLGIATIQDEGAAMQAIINADIVVNNVLNALDLFLTPLRLKSTLRG